MNTPITTKIFQDVAVTLAKYYYNILDNLNSHTDIVNSMENDRIVKHPIKKVGLCVRMTFG